MTTITQPVDYTFYTSVLGNYDYMFADDMVLVRPSAIITDFSMLGAPSTVNPGTYDFQLPLLFPSDSTPAINT